MSLFKSIHELRRELWRGRQLDRVKRFACSDRGTPMPEKNGILVDARGQKYTRLENGQIRKIYES